MSSQSFADLGVSRAVVDALARQEIIHPFAIQTEVIADVLAGRDVLARAPTGSGKTLAFGVPLVDRTAADARRPAALVLAPTRELVTQIVTELRGLAHARALRIAPVYGGVGLVKQSADAARAHVIVATPGRLEDLLARRAFRLDAVSLLVLDEADRMLDMGFRPAVDRIVGQCPSDRQTLFFSATLDGEAGQVARRYTRDPITAETGPVQRRASADVEHRFVGVTHEHRLEALVDELRRERGLTLVFVRTKRGADRLVKRLAGHDIAAAAMHGNKSQRQREQALAQFSSGRIDTLVATDVAARGIDVTGISHVINFDPPADSETYVHRIGRTGRAGAKGIGITLVGPEERRDVSRIAERLGLPRPELGGGRPASAHGAPEHSGAGHAGPARPAGHRPVSPSRSSGPAAGRRRSGRSRSGRPGRSTPRATG